MRPIGWRLRRPDARQTSPLTAESDAGVPLVAVVFPITALPARDLVEALHELDAQHVLRVLVTELALDAQADRRAVRDRQPLVVELIGQDRLRMEGIVHVDALVVRTGSVVLHRVGAMEHDVARLALGPK